MNTLFQTIALEIAAHKWDLQDQTALPTLNTLADLMKQAHQENQAGNQPRVDQIIDQYRNLYTQNIEILK